MSATLERVRQQLNQLIESAAADIEQQRQAEAAQAAQAIEASTGTAAVAAAYDQGRRDKQAEILALINEQREWLGRGGVNAISLDTLARIIGGPPA